MGDFLSILHVLHYGCHEPGSLYLSFWSLEVVGGKILRNTVNSSFYDQNREYKGENKAKNYTIKITYNKEIVLFTYPQTLKLKLSVKYLICSLEREREREREREMRACW